jgi:hypothetical protein
VWCREVKKDEGPRIRQALRWTLRRPDTAEKSRIKGVQKETRRSGEHATMRNGNLDLGTWN